jgi:hypothetical protein
MGPLTVAQQEMLTLLKNRAITQPLPEMYPHHSGIQPELSLTHTELSELQRLGLVLFRDKIKRVGQTTVNAYLIQRGTNFEQYEAGLAS